jgi:hypothetical protein
MTRKDYVKLADSLKWSRPVMGKASQYKPSEQRAREAAWCMIVRNLAEQFEADNDRFDRSRFFTAAGLED